MKQKILIFTIFLLIGNLSKIYSLTGDDILKKMENTLTAYQDSESLFEMTLGTINGKQEEVRTLKVWTAGKSKRVVKFITPAGINNVGVLALSDNEMYVYMPAYKKVRRIQGSMRNNDFQGTDFSYREMGSYNYAENYEATIKKEDDKTYLLQLDRKSSSDAPYNQLIITVDKSNYLPQKIEMYNEGNLNKVLTVLESEKSGNYWTLKRIRMENLKKNHYTEILLKNTVFDQKLLEKGTFTERFLERPVR